MFRPERRLERRDRAPATHPIDDPPFRDRQQPRPEGSARIVGVAHAVQRQEDVLHGVFRLARQRAMLRRQRPQIGRDLLEQAAIGGAVAILGARQQRRPRVCAARACPARLCLDFRHSADVRLAADLCSRRATDRCPAGAHEPPRPCNLAPDCHEPDYRPPLLRANQQKVRLSAMTRPMPPLKSRLLSGTFLPVVGIGVVLAFAGWPDGVAQSQNPCAAKKPVAGKAACGPCNPCAAAGAAGERTYTIRAGDSLASVAERTYGDAGLYRMLADYNGIADPDRIVVGQVIKLPANPCAAQKAAASPCSPCNPCVAQGMAGASDCVVPRLQTAAAQNPCAAAKPASPCNPCNPCAAANPCNPCNPCAAANPCSPCAANPCAAAANPCNPCNPCAPAEAVPLAPAG